MGLSLDHLALRPSSCAIWSRVAPSATPCSFRPYGHPGYRLCWLLPLSCFCINYGC